MHPQIAYNLCIEQVDLSRCLTTGLFKPSCTSRFDGQSAHEVVTRFAQNVRPVKAFNTLAWEVLINPQYEAGNASLFIAGDDAEAKEIVAQLCRDMGLDPVDSGGTAAIPVMETAFWPFYRLLVPHFGRDYSLRVLRRGEK